MNDEWFVGCGGGDGFDRFKVVVGGAEKSE
jgi:hypothetical protein